MNQILNNSFEHNKAINTKKFVLYLSFGSICMFFISLCSAILVRKGDYLDWQNIEFPTIFTFSTIIIIISILSFEFIKNEYKKNKSLNKILLIISIFLTFLFIILQIVGWQELAQNKVFLKGNPSGSFIYFVSLMHIIHIFLGLFCYFIFLIAIYKSKNYQPKSRLLHLELLTQYMHFIAFIWVFLFIFFKFVVYNN